MGPRITFQPQWPASLRTGMSWKCSSASAEHDAGNQHRGADTEKYQKAGPAKAPRRVTFLMIDRKCFAARQPGLLIITGLGGTFAFVHAGTPCRCPSIFTSFCSEMRFGSP